MTEWPITGRRAGRWRAALVAALALSALAGGGGVQARELLVGLLSLADDARYEARALEKNYPKQPSGRSLPALQVALDESEFSLEPAGFKSARVVAQEASGKDGLAGALDELVKKGARHVVLELPAAEAALVAAAAKGKNLLLINASAPEDALRGAQCSVQLLHSVPSHAMEADALAQYIASRKWSRPLVLHGASPGDALLLKAFNRSARRFGLKTAAQKPFKLSSDPRERELGNVLLLTSGVDHDVVVVLDADGEFARSVPYATQLPRPVVGSNGLTAQAWHWAHERYGAPQLNRRFVKRAKRTMDSFDWAAWAAVKAVVDAHVRWPKAGAAEHAKLLRQGEAGLDGFKGQRLTFRPWDGQLRQPVMLAHGNGVVALAPVEGFLHPRSVLDTLGYDQSETECKP